VTRALLDVNVLLALLDEDHVHHPVAWSWLAAEGGRGWATCALTENGFVRVITQPRYPNALTTVDAIALLAGACAAPEHRFWECRVSLLDATRLDGRRIHRPSQITDAYLLALAVAEEGRLVTLDRQVALGAVPGATKDHLVVL
jgi:toxin-antitoxin system PIN domain toxin